MSNCYPTACCQLAGSVADKRNDPEPFTRMVVQRFDHPALKVFSNPRNGDLASAEVRGIGR